jgi:hypothetical protein
VLGHQTVALIHGRELAAYHVAAPFGVDIGGVNPAFVSINPDVQYDSWLTVGITGGNVHNSISSIGIDWSSWTETSKAWGGRLHIDDGVSSAGLLTCSEPTAPILHTGGSVTRRRCSRRITTRGRSSQMRPVASVPV